LEKIFLKKFLEKFFKKELKKKTNQQFFFKRSSVFFLDEIKPYFTKTIFGKRDLEKC